MDFDFLKDRYDYELQRKEQLTTALTLPVGVLTGLGSLMAVMGKSFSYEDPTIAKLFVGFLVVDSVTFFVCLTLFALAYHRHIYVYLPLLGELEQTEQELRSYFEAIGEETKAADDDFAASLRRRIIDAADQNTKNNDDRSKFLYWARVALFAVLGFTALAGVPYIADQLVR